MKILLQILQAIALAAFIGLLGLIIIILNGLRPTIESTLRDTHATIIEAGLTAKNLREASAAWKDATKQQVSDVHEAMRSVTVASTTIGRLASASSESLSALSQQLSSALSTQNDALTANQKQLQATIVLAQGDLQTLNKTLADADAQISNPDIKKTLDGIAKSSEDADAGLKQLTAASTDLRQIADKARETYLKPVNLWWSLLKTMLPLAGSAAQVVK